MYLLQLQVENEYGSGAIGCDEDYKTWLSDTIRNHVGSNVVLFTNDSPSEQSLKCGQIAGVLQTLDFGFGKCFLFLIFYTLYIHFVRISNAL